MSTRICGTCAYYRDTALHGIICGKTNKPCGYLHEKDCWTDIVEKPETKPEPKPETKPVRRGRVSKHPNYVDKVTGHTMKWCTKCNQYKPIDDFPLNKSRKDGHAGECKRCHNAWTLEYQRKRAEIRKKVKTQVTPVVNALTEEAIVHVALQSATDQQIVEELRKRGFTGTITKSTYTL